MGIGGVDLSSFSKLGNGAFKGGLKNPNVASAAGAAIDMVSGFLPEKSVYSGTKGNIAKTADSIYDTAADVIGMVPGWGTIASLAMKGNAMLSKGVAAIGGGTDGMCVCAGTKVFTASGEIINIEDLKKEDGIIGWDKDSKLIVPLLIHDFIEPRQKECLEIVLKNGYSIKCSIDHPILSDNNPKAKNKIINGKRIAIRPWEFRRADELKVGDFVGLANNVDYWGDTNISEAYVVGLLIGDGSYGKGASCRLISADPDTWKYLENNNLGVLNHCDDSRPEKYNKEIRTYRIIGGMKLLHYLGIAHLTGKNKTLPKNIGKFDKSSVCNLLAGLFDTDGSISVNEEKLSYSITLYLSNINLLEEVRMLLHKLGIFSTIGTRKEAKYELGGKIINSKESYRLLIHDISSAIKFYNLIPLNISYKKENLEKIYNMLKNKKVQEHNDISGAKQCKIVSITPIGILTVYNLQADYNHTYLANFIITHNTTTDAILGSNFFLMTPMGLINGFGGKKSHTLENGASERETIANVGSAYGGAVSNWQNTIKYSNKKYGLFSSGARKRANRRIDDENAKMNMMTTISNTAKNQMEAATNMADANNMKYQMELQGGYDPTTRLGRKGFKIILIKTARKIAHKVKDKELDIIRHKSGGTIEDNKFFIPTDWEPAVLLDKFQKGGSINIIPEGALHARLHHMDNSDNLTKKGIPVVDNNGNQLAEIECNEIIFRKEVTEKIEQLALNGSDKAALECGKLLALEIVENTDDKTGLVPKLLNKNLFGGILNDGENPLNKIFKTPTVADLKAQQMALIQELLTNLINKVKLVLSPESFKMLGNPTDIAVDKLLLLYQQSLKDNTLEQLPEPSADGSKTISTNIGNGASKAGVPIAKMAVTAINGISNAISAGKNLKKINELKNQEAMDKAVAGTGNRDGNAQLFQQLLKQTTQYLEGGTLLDKIKSYLDLLQYLKATNRDSSTDYDLEKAYNDPEVYKKWVEEESKNPGKGHWSDKYKKPNHFTLSTESIYSTPETLGGIWTSSNGKDVFITSPYLESKHSLWEYLDYFNRNEPNAILNYGGISYGK